jgi:hypothetical protein
MAQYLVLDMNAGQRLVALRDQCSCYHVARVTAELPPIHGQLDGAKPAVGFNLMVAQCSSQVYRMIFELVNCGHGVALERLHGADPDAATAR